MNIIFNTIHIENFMSFDDEYFDFNGHSGLNLINGVNNDIIGSKNGAGKCVDKSTQIDIKISNQTILDLFNELD